MLKKDWALLRTIAAVGSVLVTAHGTTRRWQTWHTVFALAGIIAAFELQPAR